VVQGALRALMHGTTTGDVVAIHMPSYPPFLKYIPSTSPPWVGLCYPFP
jgi:bifunctional pyridoxal-dependent enzyme with beta-cystathionase and maltose regulon repressor activities